MKKTRKKTNTKDMLITFEGIDGCGKSTQLALAAEYLRTRGLTVATLREPGSTVVSERIRSILLDPSLEISDRTELLLYEAARSEVVVREIEPLLARGDIVLCDRFYDSTTAYQGYGRGLDLGMVKRLHRIAVGKIVPCLTLVFDLPLNTAFTRRGNNPDRLESQSRAFFNRVRNGFKDIAATEPRRVKLIDARPSPEQIFDHVKPILNRRLHLT